MKNKYSSLLSVYDYGNLLKSFEKSIKNLDLSPYGSFRDAVHSYWKTACGMATSPYTVVPGTIRVTEFTDGSVEIKAFRRNEGVSFQDYLYTVNLTPENRYYKAKDFLVSLVLALYRESLIHYNLTIINDFYNEVTEGFSIRFISDVFSDKKVVSFDDSSLILTADTNRVLSIMSIPEGLEAYRRAEESALLTCTTTAEVLVNKPPLVSSLLNSGKLGLYKLIKPSFNRTITQFRNFPKTVGRAYMYSSGVFGAIERTEDGVSVIVEPFNIKTLLKDDSVNLLAILKGGS